MIDEVLTFLRDQLNASLTEAARGAGEASAPELVTFVDGDKWGDSVTFALGTVSALLINLEEENTLRRADPYARSAPDGGRQRVQPDIRMNLYVLFVAHFKQYAESLRSLSGVIRFFQNHRVFNHANAPGLSGAIDHLVIELVTLPLAEQNEIWGALRTSYRPSVLYRIRMLVFQDADRLPVPLVEEAALRLQS